MPKITPHLWFDTQAKQAAKFYTSVFSDSKILSQVTINDTPSGSADFLTIRILDQEFALISAGPYFKINPSVSFLIACKTKKEVEDIWAKLSQQGKALMELGEYPFSDKYGWVEDKFGVSWQVMAMGERKIKQKITPTMMFISDQAGKAEEAINFYTSIFNHAQVGDIVRYEEGEGPDKPGTIKHATFTLEGKQFAAMDSAYPHQFGFNEAISFIVSCKTQKEIDYFWEKLSAVPKAEQCGWLKDKYGFSWQIVPTIMDEMFVKGNKQQIARVTQAFLKMKKFDIAKLKKAYGA